MTLAAVVIAHARPQLLPAICASIRGCDERVVIGDQAIPPALPEGVRYYHIPALTRTTVDALVKRDVGWAVTTSEAALFLADDHRITPEFVTTYQDRYAKDDGWDFLRPTRFTVRDGKLIDLNNGQDQYGSYVAGHGGVYRRRCAPVAPWSCIPHRNWDLLHSLLLVKKGMRLAHGAHLAIEDIEPGATPWV